MNFLSNLIGASDPIQFVYMLLARVVIILLILPLHEYAHGWMAHKFGDDTARLSGRLTLNPLAHIDPVGSVLLLLFGFGWAKPVPVNPVRMKNMRKGIIWVSLAGPFSNLIAAFVGVIVLQIITGIGVTTSVLLGLYYFFSFFVRVNLGLAVFNLIPIPPLDGSKVLITLMPYNAARWMEENSQILSIVLWILILSGRLNAVLYYIEDGLLWLFEKMTFFIPLLLG